jgi:glycosyltransferase involved in cell wall biosynthesis
VELVIDQAARLPYVQFRLAGKGETEVQCRELAEQRGCRNVLFLGHISSAQLGEEMRRADLFLFPSILEGNPQVLLQAGACGLPAVAIELYHSNYVVDGRTGFQVSTDAELADRLDRLINDSALRASFAAAAVAHTNRFDWDNITIQWAELFHRAIQKRRSTSRPNPRQRAS